MLNSSFFVLYVNPSALITWLYYSFFEISNKLLYNVVFYKIALVIEIKTDSSRPSYIQNYFFSSQFMYSVCEARILSRSIYINPRKLLRILIAILTDSFF